MKKEKNQNSVEEDFFAPPVPPPKKESSISYDSKHLSKRIKKKFNKLESEKIKPIFLKCDRCDEVILIPIPREPIIKSKKKELLITDVHRSKKKDEIHGIIFELDLAFNVIYPKSTDVIISSINDGKGGKSEEEASIRYTLVPCKRCNNTINIPVPKKIIEKSKLPKIPVAFVHENDDDEDLHCIIAYLDKNFGDRAVRLADILIYFGFPFW
ncbi:MAG: hypothetical protein EU539_00700 [Promethearchaeota archaeon]|nr:MAG: hypothetical protein EU539_00700 [Candidatus Lokiarchaeota archaeon]